MTGQDVIALHTTYLAMEMVDRHLVEHRGVIDKPEWLKLAEAAHQALYELYQAIGAEHLTK